MRRGRLLASGYIALDAITYDGAVTHRAGGTAANVAANLAFLGWRTAVAGVIGADAAGRRVAAELRESGVDTTSLASRRDLATPVVVQTITSRGHRFAFSCPECGSGTAKYRAPSSDAAGEIPATLWGEVFFFDRANAYTVSVAERAKSAGARVVFEPSTLGHATDFRAAIAVADIVKASEQRLQQFRAAFRAMRRDQIQIVTRGANGASMRIGGTWRAFPAFPAKLVDAAGAGDWTTAGFLCALPHRQPLSEATVLISALSFGQALAAESCGFVGARGMSECCTRDDVLRRVGVAMAGGLCPEPPRPGSKQSRRSRGTGCPVCLRVSENAGVGRRHSPAR
jgi:fructokinase